MPRTKEEVTVEIVSPQVLSDRDMESLSLNFEEVKLETTPRHRGPGQDVIEFDGGLSLQEEARRRPGRGRSFDSINGGDKFNKNNDPEPDLFDIVQVFASKF
tara:strand:- start:173 stop:478 length:306 start_codon:yes stop_codon:yes gene_type:complete